MEGKLFLIREGIMKLENHHSQPVIDSNENHSWILKLMGESLMRNRILI